MNTPAPAAPATVPGKTLGIVALVLAFIAAPIGFILGLVAKSQSKKAGYPNGIAGAAIIIGILGTIAYIVIFGSIAAGIAAFSSQCAELGSGVHTDGAVTITCP